MFNWRLEDIFMFVYCLILMWNYISALLEYKQNKQQLKELTHSELQAELDLLPKWRMFVIAIIGAIIFKWFLFIFAFLVVGHMMVLVAGLILIILRVYILYHRLTDLQKTKLDLYVLIGECLFTGVFILYYFGFLL